MGEEKSRDITGITVRYSDGSTKEIQSGCCVDLEEGSDDLSVEMLNVKPFDLVRLAYGLVAAVQRLGMRDELEQYADWPETPERKEGGLSYGVYKDSNGQKNVQRRILSRRI